MMTRSKKKVGKKLKKTLQVPAQSKGSKKGVITKKPKISKKLTPSTKISKESTPSFVAKKILNKNTVLGEELEMGSGIKTKTVEQAIEGVRLLEKQRNEKQSSKDLLDDDSDERNIFLQVAMVKVANLLPRTTSVVRPVKLKVYTNLLNFPLHPTKQVLTKKQNEGCSSWAENYQHRWGACNTHSVARPPQLLKSWSNERFLPNTVANSSTDVLLIAKDSEDGRDIRDDHTENLYFHERRLKLCGAARHISEVITLRQLKVEFKEYEAKRHLANRTHVVLCDDTIVRRIPMFLGKHFYEKRKFPIPVNLKAKDLLSEVERSLSIQILYLPMKGNSGLMKIGCLSQSNEMIIENIQAAVKKMLKQFPGGWDNVQTLYLKTGKSKSVPFYAKLKSPNDIQSIEPKPLSNKRPVIDEVTTEFGDVYTVYPDNNVVLTRKYNEFRSKKEESKKEKKLAKQVAETTSQKTKKGKMKKKNKDVVKDDTDIDEPAAKKKKTDTAEPATKKKKTDTADPAAKKKMSPIVSSDDKAPKTKKKGSKPDKNSKKKILDDLDLDVEEEKRLNRLEVDYLKKLKMGVDSEVKEVASDEEYDDWAEGSDEDLEDIGDEDFEF